MNYTLSQQTLFKQALLLLAFVVFITKSSAKQHSPGTAQNHVSYFLLKNESGNTINIAALKGKVLFLNFWAMSCIPCKEEMPTINQLHNYFMADTNIVVIPIDLDNDLPNSSGYMKEQGFGLGVYTAASQVPEALFHGVLPTTVVIDKDGKIVLFREGGDDYGSKKFIDYIEGLSKK